jgi:hypothetical protein
MLTPLPPPPGGPNKPILPPPPPPGLRKRQRQLVDELFQGEIANIVAVAVDLAKRGDGMMIRAILDRASPPRRTRHIEIPNFPEVRTVADVPKAMAHLAAAVVAGEITADEAGAVAGILEKFLTAVEVVDIAKEVAEIRQMQEEARATRR